MGAEALGDGSIPGLEEREKWNLQRKVGRRLRAVGMGPQTTWAPQAGFPGQSVPAVLSRRGLFPRVSRAASHLGRKKSRVRGPGTGVWEGKPLGPVLALLLSLGVAGNPGPWELCGGVGLTISQLVAECLLCAEVWDTDEGLPVWKQGSPCPQEVPENKHEGTTPRGW